MNSVVTVDTIFNCEYDVYRWRMFEKLLAKMPPCHRWQLILSNNIPPAEIIDGKRRDAMFRVFEKLLAKMPASLLQTQAEPASIQRRRQSRPPNTVSLFYDVLLDGGWHFSQ